MGPQNDTPAQASKKDLSQIYCCLQKVQAVGAKPEAGKEGAEVQDTSLPGMAFMMECYEGELKRPIRNLVNGRLLRTILIQVVTPLKIIEKPHCMSWYDPAECKGCPMPSEPVQLRNR